MACPYLAPSIKNMRILRHGAPLLLDVHITIAPREMTLAVFQELPLAGYGSNAFLYHCMSAVPPRPGKGHSGLRFQLFLCTIM